MVQDAAQFINGNRKLSHPEVALINEMRDLGELIGDKLLMLERVEGIDKRWLNIAKTDLQKGMMSLERSIAKPESF